MNTLAIVQARMASTRLPGKILADVAGEPLLARVIQRVEAAVGIHRLVVATSDAASDDVLVQWLEGAGVECFRGDERDVLSRFYRCATLYEADLIVRITADDPLKDPSLVDRAIGFFLSDPDLDYCSNTLRPTYPEGLDVEVFRYRALDRAQHGATLPSEREHVTPYIWKRPGHFKLGNFEHHTDLSEWRWTVDWPADLAFARAVFEQFRSRPLVGFEEVVEFLLTHPEVRAINANVAVRNAGYHQSTKAE